LFENRHIEPPGRLLVDRLHKVAIDVHGDVYGGASHLFLDALGVGVPPGRSEGCVGRSEIVKADLPEARPSHGRLEMPFHNVVVVDRGPLIAWKYKIKPIPRASELSLLQLGYDGRPQVDFSPGSGALFKSRYRLRPEAEVD